MDVCGQGVTDSRSHTRKCTLCQVSSRLCFDQVQVLQMFEMVLTGTAVWSISVKCAGILWPENGCSYFSGLYVSDITAFKCYFIWFVIPAVV